MKHPPPTLSPLLRSDFQGHLLATLFLIPDEERSLTSLARRLRAGLTTVHTEVERLTSAGLVLDRRVGRARMVRCNRTHPLTPALSDLLRLTYGPPTLLPAILKDVDALERAYLYGAWATRRSGKPEPYPKNVDVLLVGDVQRACLERATSAAARALRQDVRFTVVGRDELAAKAKSLGDGHRSPLFELALS